ncbi:hypothetical protein FACS1894187_18320 [Synergistales bacterium]|nr:hypothetical protein FACS1894187_18320 [Synergistales bacterium]
MNAWKSIVDGAFWFGGHETLLKQNLQELTFRSTDALADKIKSFPSDVLIYGAGGGGGVTLRLLRDYSVEPTAFIDRNAERIGSKDGLPVYHPSSSSVSESVKKKAVVLLAITLRKKEREQIMNDLRAWGYVNILDAQELNAMAVNFSDNASTWEQNINNASRTLELMADEESMETFTSGILAHASRDYDACFETDEESQYFLKKVPFSKGFSRFVDCGAYTGDTMRKWMTHCDAPEAYVGFEPMLPVYEKLSQEAEHFTDKVKACLLFPCAVGNQNTISGLDDDSPGSASVTNDGVLKIPVVRIDDALKVFAPTFIKMDIEGAEIDALLGARNTITRYKPDLAICVYHAINHYWDIPLLLDSWNLGYKFYLRAHSSATMETVLYAVQED